MRVRIRVTNGPAFEPRAAAEKAEASRRVPLPTVAHGIVAVLRPFAILAGLLAFWRIGADMNVMQPFAIAEGPFSHWQPWFAVVILLEGAALIVRQFFGSAPALQPTSRPATRKPPVSRAA